MRGRFTSVVRLAFLIAWLGVGSNAPAMQFRWCSGLVAGAQHVWEHWRGTDHLSFNLEERQELDAWVGKYLRRGEGNLTVERDHAIYLFGQLSFPIRTRLLKHAGHYFTSQQIDRRFRHLGIATASVPILRTILEMQRDRELRRVDDPLALLDEHLAVLNAQPALVEHWEEEHLRQLDVDEIVTRVADETNAEYRLRVTDTHVVAPNGQGYPIISRTRGRPSLMIEVPLEFLRGPDCYNPEPTRRERTMEIFAQVGVDGNVHALDCESYSRAFAFAFRKKKNIPYVWVQLRPEDNGEYYVLNHHFLMTLQAPDHFSDFLRHLDPMQLQFVLEWVRSSPFRFMVNYSQSNQVR